MKVLVSVGAVALLIVAAVALFDSRIDDATAQSSTPPHVFQTEVLSWLADGTADTSEWEFTYLADGTLHLMTPRPTDRLCAEFNVPEGVFVNAIASDLTVGAAPGNGSPIEICEAFFTRANG